MKLSFQTSIYFFIYFLPLYSHSQFRITIVVKQPSVLHSIDQLFVAGNFNSWDPGDKNFELTNNNDGTASITVALAEEIMNIKSPAEAGKKWKHKLMAQEFKTGN